jgi:hypothetical protein
MQWKSDWSSMAMSRRRLSFREETQTTATAGGKTCTLCLGSHTQFSLPNIKALCVDCAVMTLAGWLRTLTLDLGGKEKIEKTMLRPCVHWHLFQRIKGWNRGTSSKYTWMWIPALPNTTMPTALPLGLWCAAVQVHPLLYLQFNAKKCSETCMSKSRSNSEIPCRKYWLWGEHPTGRKSLSIMLQSPLDSSVKQTFSSFVSKAAQASHLHVEEKVTARWVMSNLILCLQHHISYTCRIRKHGTILYRSNGDLLTSISHRPHMKSLRMRSLQVQVHAGIQTN